MLEAAEALPGDAVEFTLSELVPALEESEAWAYAFAKHSGEEGVRLKASAIGNFLRSFRLKPRKTKHANFYSREEVIKVLSAHTPGSSRQSSTSQVPKNNTEMERVERVEPVEPFPECRKTDSPDLFGCSIGSKKEGGDDWEEIDV